MSIHIKLLLLLIGALLLLIGSILLLRFDQQRTLNYVAENEVRQHLQMLERLVDLKSQSLENLAADYSFWDEFVSFIASPEPTWAKQNLDTALHTFAVDNLWVLRPDGTPIHAATRGGTAPPPSLPLSFGTVQGLFQHSKLPHFFVADANGLIEIYATGIHPTRDPLGMSPPAGYLLVGRHWDQGYIAALSSLAGVRLQLSMTLPAVGQVDHASGRTDFNLPLPAPDGRPAAWLTGSTTSGLISHFHATFNLAIALLLAGSLIALLSGTLLVRSWITRPLQRVIRALAQGTVEELGPLRDADHEFGELARLIESFFVQQQQLQLEVAERAQAETALRTSEAKFNQIFDNVPVSLLALDGRLHITHVNIAAQKLFGYMHRELTNEHFSLLLHPDDLGEALLRYREIREGRRIFQRAEVRYLDKNGDVLRGRQTDVAICAPHRELLFIVSMIEDLCPPSLPPVSPEGS